MQNKLFVLISTIDSRILNLKNIVQKNNIETTYIISHQVTKTLEKECQNYIDTLEHREDVIYDSLCSMGVAKNRNNTLRFIEPKSICLILDDDVLLCQDIFKNVIKAFNDNLNADFISFKILDLEGKDYKSYPKEIQWHTSRTLTGIGTTEIAFRSELVLDNKIVFDEDFGPGAKRYPMGEDFIFAMDIHNSKAKMLFVPIAIVKHPRVSTGSSLDAKVIFARGAVFARVFGRWAYMLNMYFSLKHKKMYKNSLSFASYLRLMTKGSYAFLRRRRNDA